jgi:hypothetical protein
MAGVLLYLHVIGPSDADLHQKIGPTRTHSHVVQPRLRQSPTHSDLLPLPYLESPRARDRIAGTDSIFIDPRWPMGSVVVSILVSFDSFDWSCSI